MRVCDIKYRIDLFETLLGKYYIGLKRDILDIRLRYRVNLHNQKRKYKKKEKIQSIYFKVAPLLLAALTNLQMLKRYWVAEMRIRTSKINDRSRGIKISKLAREAGHFEEFQGIYEQDLSTLRTIKQASSFLVFIRFSPPFSSTSSIQPSPLG